MFSRRPERARPAGADAQQRQGAGLRGGRPGHRRVRAGQDRGLHLEGPAGHGDLHRVRAVPVAVPGLGHRQAAVPQAGHPGPARPRLRQGPVPAGRLRRGAGEAARRGQGRGRAAAGRDQGRQRRHRPGRAVVVHELRGVRGGVPGRHRAHRPHRRDAPAPGADRVRVPGRGGRDAAEPGEQGRPLGHGREPPRPTGSPSSTSRSRSWTGRSTRRDRVPVLGRLRGRAGGPGEEDHQGHRHPAAPGRGEVRGARPGRDVHRGPGPADRERVRVLHARPAEHRDPERGRREEGRGVSCPHCFNTISREYPQLGGNYEVIHHTQLLARLVDEGTPQAGRARSRRS